MSKNNEQDVKLEIQIDDVVSSGQYINMAVVNHNDSEFVLDCLYVQPQAPKAKVQARLITSPRHAKRLMLALQNNVSNYEQRYGAIVLEEEKPRPLETDKPIH